jgi:two-component system response regulator RegX3
LAGVRVLLLATRRSLLDALVPQLASEGFEVEVVSGADEALRARGVRVAAIDVTVGRDEARRACDGLRAASEVPIIVFAGDRVEGSLVEYLDWGADDYLPRPERLRELVARVRALVRRSPEPAGGRSPAALEVGGVRLDPERHEVTVRGRPVELPLKQFQLLELFLANAGQVLTRATILRRVWGADSPADSNTLEVQVKRLRRHIEDDPSAPARIRTVRGLGYLYADDR